jgi:hypothetical protein
VLTLSVQDPVLRTICRSLQFKQEQKMKQAAQFFGARFAMGQWIQELAFGDGLNVSQTDGWIGPALALVHMATNLRAITLQVWTDSLIITTGFTRAETLRVLTLEVSTASMLQLVLDSVVWINLLIHLERLDIDASNLADTFHMEAARIPVLCLPSLNTLHFSSFPSDGLLLFFAHAQLVRLQDVVCSLENHHLVKSHVLRFLHSHPRLRSLAVDVFFCEDDEIVSSISAARLQIMMMELGCNPQSYFLQYLASSVKALALSHINADSGSTGLWKFLDELIGTASSSVVEIHLETAFLDADQTLQPFRWVHDVTDRLLQEKKLQLHGRLLAYVPVLAKRGISMFDSTGRTLQDYMK